jgi:ribose/xylose/arabinose/galactoside ABC-type transport system permease subunit
MIHGEVVMADLIIIALISIVFVAGFFFGLGQILKTKSAEQFLSNFSDWFKSISDGRLFLAIIGLIVFIVLLWLFWIKP